MGPMAITSLLLGVSCQKYGYEEGSAEYILVAMNISMLVGFVLFTVGVCKMGTLINLLSHSVLVGFISASALVILINQLKYVLGMTVPRFTYIHQTVWYLLSHLNEANGYASALGLGTWGILLAVREVRQRLKAAPARMSSLAMSVLSAVGNVSNFAAIVAGMLVARAIITSGGSVPIVGDVPSGIKTPGFVFVDFATFLDIIPASLALAFVSFAGNWAVAKKFAAKGKYEIDATQELVGEGLTNIIGVLFNSFVVSGGLARSAVNAESGAKTQIAGCITALCILLSILLLTSFLYYIPMASLGAVIEVSIVPLINLQEMAATYRVDKKDCLVMVTTFLITLLVGVTEGLFVGVFVSAVIVMRSSAFPYVAHLGRVLYSATDEHDRATSNPLLESLGSGCDSARVVGCESVVDSSELPRYYYQDVRRFPHAVQLPGVAIVRMDASLYYANCDFFKESVKRAAAGEFHSSKQPIRQVIVDASAWIDIDLAGVTALFELKRELAPGPQPGDDPSAHRGGLTLSVVNVKGVIRDRFRQSKFLEELGDSHLNMTIDDAIHMRPRCSSASRLLEVLGRVHQQTATSDEDEGGSGQNRSKIAMSALLNMGSQRRYEALQESVGGDRGGPRVDIGAGEEENSEKV